MKPFFTLFYAASALSLSTAIAAEESFSGINEIVVEDFIGTVNVRVASGDARITYNAGNEDDYEYTVEQENGVLKVFGEENPNDMRWWKRTSWRDGENAFENFLKDYPVVEITVPAGTDLRTTNTVIKLSAGDLNSNVVTESGHVEGEIGNIISGKIGVHGSGDITVGDVAERLRVSIHGSGDIRAGKSAELIASVHGSGGIRVGDVAGDAEANIHGSGDITLRNIGGAADLSSHGSGDIEAGVIGNGLTLSSHGSGDFDIASSTGPMTVSQHGSGDATIDGGRAEDLRVRIYGSGDFKFDGIATNPDLSSNSSGDIYIARHEGKLKARGRGDIRVGGRDYGDND